MGRLTPNIRIAIALAIPLLALLALTASKQLVVTFGKEYTLPITGFDPRDLLSGHYLIYRIDYKVPVCNNTRWDREVKAMVCLTPRYFNYSHKTNDCTFYILGTCTSGRFTAGIEKFFIPEEHANILDRAVRGRKGSLVVSVTGGGRVAVENLLIDGQTWQNYIKPEQ